MSCGYLHFNPIAQGCDWPANVIQIRPECGKTFKTFRQGLFFDRATTTTTKPSQKEPRLFIVNGVPEKKKRRPNIIEIVLKPEVFLNKTYVYEDIDNSLRSGGDLEDDPDYLQDFEDVIGGEDLEYYDEYYNKQADPDSTETTTTTLKPEEAPIQFPTIDVTTMSGPSMISEADGVRENSSRKLDMYDDKIIFPRFGVDDDGSKEDMDLSKISIETIEKYIKANIDKFRKETFEAIVKAPTTCYCPCADPKEGDRTYDDAVNNLIVKGLEDAPSETRSLDPPSTPTTPVLPDSADGSLAVTTTQKPTTTSLPETTPFETNPVIETATLSTKAVENSSPSSSSSTTEETEQTTLAIISKSSTPSTSPKSTEASTQSQTDEVSTYYPVTSDSDDNMSKEPTTTNEIPEPLTDQEEVTYYPILSEENTATEQDQPRLFPVDDITDGLFSSREALLYTDYDTDASSDSIAACISQFLTCLDKGSEEDLTSLEESCYDTFQECSGSVILIPDLYNQADSSSNTVELEKLLQGGGGP